jgi:hypothetical protein
MKRVKIENSLHVVLPAIISKWTRTKLMVDRAK